MGLFGIALPKIEPYKPQSKYLESATEDNLIDDLSELCYLTNLYVNDFEGQKDRVLHLNRHLRDTIYFFSSFKIAFWDKDELSTVKWFISVENRTICDFSLRVHLKTSTKETIIII